MFNSKSDFDFSVRIDEHIVTAMPGQAVNIPVTVNLDRGESQPINLSVSTHWESAGLIAQINPSVVNPDLEIPAMAMMTVGISESTKPGKYLFTVQGETGETFGTSQDAVTVVVVPKGKPKPGENPKPKPANPVPANPSPNIKNPPPARPSWNFLPFRKTSPKQNRTNVERGLGSSIFHGLLNLIIIAFIFWLIWSFFSGGIGGKVRNCIGSIFPGNYPECSDCSKAYEHTTINGKSMGNCTVGKVSGDTCQIISCK
jgi:hypothetical protein